MAFIRPVFFAEDTAEGSTTTAQLQPQKKNTTDLTLYTDPEAPIKRGDILYIYELDEYDKPIMSTEFSIIALFKPLFRPPPPFPHFIGISVLSFVLPKPCSSPISKEFFSMP